jgi:DNA-binding NarL/FixJ family response regulator
MIWRDLRGLFQRKRLFAMDVDSFDALRLIAKQQGTHPNDVAARLVQAAVDEQALRDSALEYWEMLSPREKQVTALICLGLTTRQIASRLQLAPTTVKTHAENTLHKFRAANREVLRQMLSDFDLSQYE